MAITDKEKEAIKIVVNMLDRRIKWIQENEPHATKELDANYMASSMVLELEHLSLSE